MNNTMTTRPLSDDKLEQLRLAVGLHYSYGYGDVEEKGLRFRLRRFLHVFGVPLADTVTERQALAAAAVIWEKYVPAVRVVTASTGGTLTLFSAVPGLAPGDAIEVSKGCDRTMSLTTGCGSFSNVPNFSGFDKFVTPKNVFSEGAA